MDNDRNIHKYRQGNRKRQVKILCLFFIIVYREESISEFYKGKKINRRVKNKFDPVHFQISQFETHFLAPLIIEQQIFKSKRMSTTAVGLFRALSVLIHLLELNKSLQQTKSRLGRCCSFTVEI